MSERTPVNLRDGRAAGIVQAVLIDGVTREEIERAQAQWKPVMVEAQARWAAEGRPREKWPQHSHWNWLEKKDSTSGLLAYGFYGIEAEGEMQGLMMVSTAGNACRIASQKGKPLVYVEYLTAAPWNLRLFVPEPRYRSVGPVLIAAAVQLSRDEEFAGRIGLHSLSQSDDWYRDVCGMTDLGQDPAAGHLRYFEMTPEQASNFLK